jgi:hypothetical protein
MQKGEERKRTRRASQNKKQLNGRREVQVYRTKTNYGTKVSNFPVSKRAPVSMDL